MIERLQQRIQELELQQLQQDSPAEKAKTKSNVWDDGSMDVNPFGERKPRYRVHFFYPRHNDLAVDRGDRYRDDHTRSMRLKIKIPEFTEERNMTMEEVIIEFDKLYIRCDVVEEEKQVVARFLGVLKPKIADIFSPFLPASLAAIAGARVLGSADVAFQSSLHHEDHEQEAGGSNLFMKKTDFERLVKTSPYVFTRVVVEENEIISEARLQVHSLFKEFADVILDDIPPRLSAMRDIQLCIDFIPSSAIPNRPAYRMNLKEFVKHQRQVT
nr:putative reverse transcriptase domain, zinc finger, CCHC-type, aspartic peptidase domain protein [Tanacetum cinerariifolium]